MQANVVVIGSLNMDLVTRAPRLPRAGETLAGHGFATLPGGKGANQAVAAARLGAQVAMVGCVGSDAYGAQLREGLIAEGIDASSVSVADDTPTGVAMIVVDDSSQNAIIIVAGGNGELTAERVRAVDHLLQAAELVVCQLEVPLPTVEYALQRAHALGKTVVLNPAPATGPLPTHWYPWIDYLIPNETEANLLTRLPVDSPETAEAAARQLLAAGAGTVIVTLGEQGALRVQGEHATHFPVAPVQAVDTTAAGDTFVGGFVAALASGRSEEDAIRFGQAAAAVSVTRAGAQPSIPYAAELGA